MAGFGGAVKLTGESEYRKSLQKITQNLKEVTSEMKSVSASYDSNDKSVEAVTAKTEALNKVQAEQTKKLETLQAQYSSMSEKYKEQTSKHEQLVNSYNEEKNKLDTLAQTVGTASKEYQDQQTKVADLAQAVDKSTKAQDANEKSMSNMRVQINNAQADVNKTTKSLDELGNEAEESGKKAEQSSEGFTVMKGVLADLASKAIQGVISGLKQLGQAAMDAYNDYDAGADIIIQKTGAVGEAGQALQDSYNNVSKSVVGSFEDIGTAVGEVNTRFGLTGSDLEDLSTKFLKFAELNGVDVNDSIDSVQKNLEAFGLSTEDAGSVLDTFNKVGQDTGISMDTLSADLTKNASTFQQLGLDIHQSAGFMGQIEKSGIDTSVAMAALSRASKNAADEGKPLTQVLEETQEKMLNASSESEALQIAYDTFGAKAGASIYNACKTGSLSFDDLSKAMEDNSGSIDKTYEATQDGLDKIKLAFQGVKADVGEVVGSFLDEHKDEIANAIETVSEAIKDAFNFIKDNGDTIIAVITGIATAVGAYVAYTTAIKVMKDGWMALEVVQKAVAGAQALLNAVMSANPIGIVIALIVGLVAAFVVLWNKSEGFREFWIGLWEKIKEVAGAVAEWFSETWTAIVDWFSEAWENIKNFASDAWDGIKETWSAVAGWFDENIIQPVSNFFSGMWDGIKGFASGAWEGIKETWSKVKGWFNDNIIKPVGNFFKGMWDKLKSGAKGAWDGIKSVFSSVTGWFKDKFSAAWKAVKNVFSTGGKVFDGIKEGITKAFKTVVNAIIRGINKVVAIPFNAINGVLNTLRNLSILGVSPFGWIGSIKVPQIPTLAKGGILKRGEIGLLEGNGAEAVVPLENNKKWIRKVADDLRLEMNGTGKADSAEMNYNTMVDAFKDALSQMKVELDDDEVGRFIDKTVTRLVYN